MLPNQLCECAEWWAMGTTREATGGSYDEHNANVHVPSSVVPTQLQQAQLGDAATGDQ